MFLCKNKRNINIFVKKCLYLEQWWFASELKALSKKKMTVVINSGVSQIFYSLTLGTLGKIFSRHFEIYFLIFPRKQDLTFHANCLHWRQFA